MRHLKKGKKFHRISSDRKPFLRNMVNNLFVSERVETTEARAKAIRPLAEKLITHGKKQTLAARRLILSRVHNKDVAAKIYEEIAPRYESRKGGYTRIIKIAKSRKRDGGRVARIEFV